MQKVQPKEIARRQAFFKAHNFDPSEVKLIMPDITFDSEMTINLGGREVRPGNLQDVTAMVDGKPRRIKVSTNAIKSGLVIKPLKRKYGYTAQQKAAAK